ncbi:pyruvate kinase, partial [Candidatus Micrarchaeota archaeon]|nr:pyruvate kinase [Candidatus Micrarchaeota archaeon]
MNLKKTKIVCTIGPACDSSAVIAEMLEAGMDVARLNYSHGTPEKHADAIKKLRAAARRLGKHVELLVDLPGPKTRVGLVKNNSVRLTEGGKIVLTTRKVLGTSKQVTVNLPEFPRLVEAGKVIYLADGLIELKVLNKTRLDVECLVTVGGELNSLKGVAIPNVLIPTPALSKRDYEGIRFAVAHKVDFIAQSFVRRANDVRELKKTLSRFKSGIKVVAKIEDALGLKNVDEIIAASDGVMIARGDLGVQIPFQDVPFAQKSIIKKCNATGKPVITATQMLESMIHSPRPTRAEVTDVANAILDGSDAVMLSGETATGEFPVRAVQAVSLIAERTRLYSR